MKKILLMNKFPESLKQIHVLTERTKKQNVFLIIAMLENEKYIEWICRVLMTLDLFTVTAGYISYFKAKHQLASPLIPITLVSKVLFDNNFIYMRASLICGGLFLAGLWFYTFKKKIPAIVLFILAIIFYKLFLNVF